MLKILSLAAATLFVPRAVPTFEDVQDFVITPAGKALLAPDDYDRAVTTLAREFGGLCGDTFCEGDDGDLTPLSLTCSVDRQSRRIGQCSWTFVGLTSEVDPATGRVVVSSHVYPCDLAVHGSAADLATFVSQVLARAAPAKGPALTTVPLPGGARTTYDALTQCL